ncbi:hypothetical protein J3R74_004287 [Puniceicoccus vermicola]
MRGYKTREWNHRKHGIHKRDTWVDLRRTRFVVLTLASTLAGKLEFAGPLEMALPCFASSASEDSAPLRWGGEEDAGTEPFGNRTTKVMRVRWRSRYFSTDPSKWLSPFRSGWFCRLERNNESRFYESAEEVECIDTSKWRSPFRSGERRVRADREP